MMGKRGKPEKTAKVETGEILAKIAAKVREDSGNSIKLTAVASLGTIIPGADAERIDRIVASLQGDEKYSDIKLIANSLGGRFLYSETFMTGTYAGVLARVEANDPLLTIAETIRDQSRIFRRPTNSILFAAPVFDIDANSLDECIAELAKRPEYADVKLVVASTGARYLYSDIYVKSEEFVKAVVEREEVYKPENP